MAEVWEDTISGVKAHGSYGSRDMLIIVSSESLEGSVPRKNGELTKEDRDRLTNQGIPQESWHDDARLMEARYNKDRDVKKIHVENDPASKRGHILNRITNLFNNTTQPGGMRL